MDANRIRKLEEQRYRAMASGDLNVLEQLLDEALTYTHSSGVVDTKASYIAGVRDRVLVYKNILRDNERVVTRANCALVFCRLRIDLLMRGAPRKVDSNALAVWVQDGEHCRLLAVHSSPAS